MEFLGKVGELILPSWITGPHSPEKVRVSDAFEGVSPAAFSAIILGRVTGSIPDNNGSTGTTP